MRGPAGIAEQDLDRIFLADAIVADCHEVVAHRVPAEIGHGL